MSDETRSHFQSKTDEFNQEKLAQFNLKNGISAQNKDSSYQDKSNLEKSCSKEITKESTLC